MPAHTGRPLPWPRFPGAHAVVAAATLALLAPTCAGVCAAGNATIAVGGNSVVADVPYLEEEGEHLVACAGVATGYSGDAVAKCVFGSVQVSTAGCRPIGCPVGTAGQARLGVQETLRPVAISRSLTHRQVWSARCAELDREWEGWVWLRCFLGEVQADASTCRPTASLRGERMFWRLVNAADLSGTWRVFEASFHTSPDCVSGNLSSLPGVLVSSSEDTIIVDGDKRNMVDQDRSTAWSPRCEGGCRAGVAWIGYALEAPAERVRCINLLQSTVACCESTRVQLEVWDGATWQVMQVWDTAALPKTSQYGIRLQVPITCDAGKPEGEGIGHNCDGLPVVGLQEGDKCSAQCSSGYYGEREVYACQEDGAFTGIIPVCYNADTVHQGLMAMSAVFVVLMVTQQYRFWCMSHKLQLSEDPEMIHPEMKGRWLEKGGMSFWKYFVELKAEEQKKSAFGFEGDHKKREQEEEEEDPGKGKNSKKKKDKAMERKKELLEVGDRVKVLIVDKILIWQPGTVCTTNPLTVQVDGWSTPWSWDIIEAIDVDKKKEKEEAGETEALMDAVQDLKRGMFHKCCRCFGKKEPVVKKSDGLGSPRDGSPGSSPRSPRDGDGNARERKGKDGKKDPKDKGKKKNRVKKGGLFSIFRKKDPSERTYSAPRVFLDGLCSICEDPDICWSLLCCPLCRIADTWHSMGMPAWLDYWKVFFLYSFCPCCWPCLNFYGRLRVRRLFEIPKEPHRDCIIHLCCCCCCTPCGLCQEARLVDAPNQFKMSEKRLHDLKAEGLRA